MISYEEAGRVLDDAVDALPEEIFRDLNGGVNLIRSSRTDEHGLLIMGTYNVNQMGRYVEIYYGSFRRKYAADTPEKCARELVHTLKHELTHHIESLAMDNSLEKWDEQHVAELLAELYEAPEPMDVDSILFVDGDGRGLAELACAMFIAEAGGTALEDMRTGSASLSVGALSIKAVRAAERYEVRLGSESATRELTRELCEVYDAIMCMTEDECGEIIRRWPDMEDRVMCLGETDMRPPRLDTQGAWNRAADAVAAEISVLTQELLGGDEQDD